MVNYLNFYLMLKLQFSKQQEFKQNFYFKIITFYIQLFFLRFNTFKLISKGFISRLKFIDSYLI